MEAGLMALADWPPVSPGSLADTSWNKSDRKALPGGTNAGIGRLSLGEDPRETTQSTALWKKLALANRLKKEDIDVACIQESHLTPHPKHGRRLSMKGYQTFKQDKQDGPKGGVITLVKNDITASEIKVNTGDRKEMIGTELHFKDKNITIYNCYCPPGKEHALHAMNISDQCIVVGDFNSHSASWGYENQDARGEEVEDWRTNMSLLLLNSPEDPPPFYSRSWMTTSNPNLAFAIEEIALKTTRQVMDQVGELTLQWIPGAGHSNIEGNERADNLAKLGSGLDQEETTILYQEAKTMIRMAAGE
ncbi:RNA-directed DNA polymerase from mobile element jockey [Elysia marginata]|uniref:RNA-directed DNA polymerase from mobile element jockey n=1 Tax=Elysia marginata TaxID=1093978 RepID=A0AAV4FP00_9GAST|nr:RNA-directed DNA polymerase from mobile element jockey [Elysia marginata]